MASALPRLTSSRAHSFTLESAAPGLGELSPEIVRAAAGKDDLSITHFTWAAKGLLRISGLSTFPNICHLDLSNNAIRSISNLSSLVALRKLVLTNNRIAKVEGLEGLLSLEHLLLQENMLQTLSSLNLPMLASLPCLSTVYLQNHDGKQANPVCRKHGYKAAVLGSLPHIQNLDGARSPQIASRQCPAELAPSDKAARFNCCEPSFKFEPPARWLDAADLVVPAPPAPRADALANQASCLEHLMDVCAHSLDGLGESDLYA